MKKLLFLTFLFATIGFNSTIKPMQQLQDGANNIFSTIKYADKGLGVTVNFIKKNHKIITVLMMTPLFYDAIKYFYHNFKYFNYHRKMLTDDQAKQDIDDATRLPKELLNITQEYYPDFNLSRSDYFNNFKIVLEIEDDFVQAFKALIAHYKENPRLARYYYIFLTPNQKIQFRKLLYLNFALYINALISMNNR